MKKIIIVDDEPDILFLAGIILRKAGYEVIETSSGEECLKKLKKEKVDLILLDILGVKGCKILEKIKGDERFKSIPVVMFTVVTEERAASTFGCARYDGYIEKPFSREEMLKTIDRLSIAPKTAVA